MLAINMTKFYVYASGRWCEVDAKDGSVSGWRGKARFVYCRRGRLEVARPRAVLRGLQALQAGAPTTVRDGPRLSQRRCVNKEPSARRLHRRLIDTHTHCCTHAHKHAHTCNNNTDCNAPKPLRNPENHVKIDAGTQVQADVHVQTVTATFSSSPLNQSLATKRKHQESSLDETFEVTKLKAGSKLRLTKIKTPQTISKTKKKDLITYGEGTEIVQPKKKVKLSPVKRRPGPAKRKRSESSSSDAITKPELKPATSKRRVSVRSDSDSDFEIELVTRNKSPQKSPSKQKVSVSSNSDSDFEITEPEKSPTKPKPATSKRPVSVTSSSDSDVELSKLETRNSTSKNNPVRRSDATKINKPDSRNRNEKNSRLELKSKRRESVSFDSDSTVIISKREPKNQLAKKSPVKQKSLRRGNLERVLLSELTKPIRKHADASSSNEMSMRDQDSAILMSNWLAKTNPKKPQVQHAESCKELIIEDSDVEVMRQFLIKYAMDIDIEAFDGDDEYKRMVFYRINPLVNVERSPIIAAMCRREAQREVTLQDFVSNLGLRSITDSPSLTSSQYKTRSKIAKNERRSSNDTDKENLKKPSDRKEIRKESRGVKNGRIQKKAGPRNIINNRARVRERYKTSVVSSGSERERDGAIRSKQDTKTLPNGPAKTEHIISKRPMSCPTREYSNLEDHAIVSWVSVGGRASRVNGNQVWRELQPVFPRLGAGLGRSWHSLRNRYLRYILPSLAKLHLPMEHVARLRAAAATGAIKNRNRPPRRNSIFNKEAGESGAWSRRPRTPPSEQTLHTSLNECDAEHSPPRRSLRSSVRPSPGGGAPQPAAPGPPTAPRPRTPRYSELTRQFSTRHARPLSGSSSPPPPPLSPSLLPRGNRKKLFNPKAIP